MCLNGRRVDDDMEATHLAMLSIKAVSVYRTSVSCRTSTRYLKKPVSRSRNDLVDLALEIRGYSVIPSCYKVSMYHERV